MTEATEPSQDEKDEREGDEATRPDGEPNDDDATHPPREFRETGDRDDEKGEADEGQASDDDEAPPQ